MVWAIAGAVVVAVFLLMYYLLTRTAGEGDSQLQFRRSDSSVTNSVVSGVDSFISKTRRDKVATQLSVAGLSFRPAEWAVLRLSLALALGGLGWLSGGPLLGAVGAVVGFSVAAVVLRFKISSRRSRFEEDLPETLQLVAGSLRSGLSLQASLDSSSVHARDPMGAELKRVLAKARVGVPIEDGLDDIADRMDSQDFQWVALSVRIQREVGGNLADILTTTAETIRERAYMKRQVKALSAEGRLSTYILLALPVVMFGFFFVRNRSYVEILWTTLPGLSMLGYALFMMLVGYFWMRATVRLED